MDSFGEVFALVLEYCSKQVPQVPFSLWLKDIKPVRMEGSTAYLSVLSEFKQNVVKEKYLDLLERGFEEVMGFPVKIELISQEVTRAQARKAEDELRRIDPSAIEHATEGGEYEYTFDTFIVGSSNEFAHAAALAVATNPAGGYNPLFIYGGSGLGKTHLMRAICNRIATNRPELDLIYIKSEDFTNELISAIRNETTTEFQNKYRHADVLLVDDIQFIAGKDSTQEEFFHTFDTLHQAGKQIVLVSDRPPKEIKTLEERLRTRFEWGLIADIQPPTFETRVAIIRRKAELLDIEIPDDVAEYIANKLKTNIRQLEGAVKKLKAYKLYAGTPPSILIAQNAIRDILNDHQPTPVTVERIIGEVARTFNGVTPEDIRSQKRTANISSARQIAAYVIREVTQITTQMIGEELGGRDHSTVVYAIKQCENNMKHDPSYRETVEDIIKNVRSE